MPYRLPEAVRPDTRTAYAMVGQCAGHRGRGVFSGAYPTAATVYRRAAERDEAPDRRAVRTEDRRHLAYGYPLFPRPATDRERARAEKIPARYARYLDTRRLEL